jgi:hypothetical protein
VPSEIKNPELRFLLVRRVFNGASELIGNRENRRLLFFRSEFALDECPADPNAPRDSDHDQNANYDEKGSPILIPSIVLL